MAKKSSNSIYLYLMTISLTIILVFVIINFLILAKITTKIDEMPKRVCHTEYNVTFYETTEWGSYQFPLDAEFMCEDGVEVVTYKYSGYHVIWGYKSEPGKKCFIKEPIEICEMK